MNNKLSTALRNKLFSVFQHILIFVRV